MYNNPFSIKSSGYSASGFSALANAYAKINTKKQLFSAINNGAFNFGVGGGSSSLNDLLAQLAAFMQNQTGNNAAGSLLSSKLSPSGSSGMTMKDFENLVNQLLENEDLYKELEKVGYGLDAPTITDITNKFVGSIGGTSSELYNSLSSYLDNLQQASTLLNIAESALSAKENAKSMLNIIDNLTQTINNLTETTNRGNVQSTINNLIKELFDTKNTTTGLSGDNIFGETDTTIKITTGSQNVGYNQTDYENAQTQITTPTGTSGMTALQAQKEGYTVVRSTEEFLNAINKAEKAAVEKGETTIDTKIMLFADIDLSEADFDGIGKYTTTDAEGNEVTTTLTFIGILDGNGYSIKNLNLDATDENYVGLIAKTGSKTVTEKVDGEDVTKTVNAEVKNLTLENVTVKGGDYTGALIGSASNTNITNITIKDTTNEQTANQISGGNYTGGLVGNLENSTVEKVNAIVNVAASNANAGGIAGVATNSSFENVTVAGTLLASGDATIAEGGKLGVGGLVGLMSGSSDKAYIKNSYANVDITRAGILTVTGENYFEGTGGLVGVAMGTSAENSEVQILNSYATGSVSNAIEYTGDLGDYFAGHSASAGLVGYGYELIVENSYAKGDVFASTETTMIDRVEQEVKLNAQNSAGGLIGVLETGNVTASYSTGDVNSNNYAGGLIGYASGDVAVDSSFAKGDVVTGATGIASGGLIGATAGTANVTQADTTNYTLVSTADELKQALLNNENVKLTKDIDLSTTTDGWVDITDYSGTFDGQNFTLSNLEYSEGLFASTNGATIKNVTLDNFTITNSSSNYTGALVGEAHNTTIDNVHVQGGTVTQSGSCYYTGGLVGYAYHSDISNSSSSASVSGYQYTGGLVGYASYGSISYSYSTGNVSGRSSYTGGFVGYSGDAVISNSYSSGTVSSTGTYVGGFAPIYGR